MTLKKNFITFEKTKYKLSPAWCTDFVNLQLVLRCVVEKKQFGFDGIYTVLVIMINFSLISTF